MRFLVSGLINIETTLKVDAFPIAYDPVRYPFHGVRSTVSGVGYNVAKALATLGHEVRFLSMVGKDFAGSVVRTTLAQCGIDDRFVVDALEETPQSVILYDGSGRRAINVDLKTIQETEYPPGLFDQAVESCNAAVLCNINFSRAFLKQAKIPVATDVHAISNPDDEYNRDFMERADILFMSHERLPCPPEEWIVTLRRKYDPAVIGIGLGESGALLHIRGERAPAHFPAVKTRPVVNTIGGGDALFSSFLHGYLSTRDAPTAMRHALVFASWKIGATGAAEGFLTSRELEARTG